MSKPSAGLYTEPLTVPVSAFQGDKCSVCTVHYQSKCLDMLDLMYILHFLKGILLKAHGWFFFSPDNCREVNVYV